MSDPLSIAAGVVGITAVAVNSIQSLLTVVRGIQQAPKSVEQIYSNLGSVESAVASLTKAFTSGAPVAEALRSIVTDIKLADMVNNCGDFCKAFEESLKKWTKHTTPSHSSKRDRFVIAFEDHAIGSFHSQLNACKQTLDIAINISTLLAQNHQINMTDQVRIILQEQEKNMLQLIEATKTQTQISREVEAELQVTKGKSESRAERQDIQYVIEFFADEQKAFDHYRTACEWVYKQTQSKRAGVNIEGVHVNESSTMIMGITNIDKKDLGNKDVQVDIKKVVVGGNSVTFMGYQNLDTNADIFKRH